MQSTLGPQPRSTGRPREPVPGDVATEVLEWLSSGHPLTAFCRQPGNPSRRTIHDWRDKDPEFRREFEVARRIGFDMLADETLAIADELPPTGRADAGFVARQHLRIDVRLRRLSVWFPIGRCRARPAPAPSTLAPEEVLRW